MDGILENKQSDLLHFSKNKDHKIVFIKNYFLVEHFTISAVRSE